MTPSSRLRGDTEDREMDATVSGPSYMAEREALQDVLDHPYWQRRWIIQEVAVSRTTQIVCGVVSLDLDVMSEVLGECMKECSWTTGHELAPLH